MSSVRIHRSFPAEGVLLAEIDRPPVNAYDFELLDALESLAAGVASDPEVKVVLLGSRLPRVFSAGADLNVFLAVDPERRTDLCHRCREVQEAFHASPKPWVALIEGGCLGGGAEIALACDVRFMARGEARIGFPEVTLGILPASGGTQTLPRLIGRGAALDLLLSGRSVGADEAHEIGLVEHVADADAVRDRAISYAAGLAKLPGEALTAVKDCVSRGLRAPLREGLALELENVRKRFQDPKVDERMREAVHRSGDGE